MKKKLIAGILSLIMAVTPFVSLPAISYADSGTCGVERGATRIFEGMATDDEDITIWNDKMAVSFAVGSNNYWNMTKGSILDICAIDSSGKWGPDLVNDVEFLMDLWTATGEYKGTDLRNDVTVTSSLTQDKKTVTVTSEYKYWVADPNKDGVNDDALPLDIKQVYTLKAGDSHLSMKTTVTNPNEIDYGNETLNPSSSDSTGMFSGYSISTNAANMFGPFGYYPDTKATGIAIGNNKNVKEHFGKFVTTYKDDYAVSLIMDGSDSYKGSSGYKDLYINQVIKAKQSYSFTGEVLVETANSTASVLDRIYARDGIGAGDTATVSGTVTDEKGNPVKGVNVIVKKDGKYMCTKRSGSVNGATVDTPQTIEQPMVWAITDKDGRYSFKLPKTTNSFDGKGTYEYKLKLEAAGYTSQTTKKFELSDNKIQNFTIEKGAPIILRAKDQNGKAIPFRVEISGVTYENKCAGISTYFSDSTGKQTDMDIKFNLTQAEGVTFTASYGKNFESKAVTHKTNVTADGVEYEFEIPEIVDPKESGWVSMDNHQHSDYGDGATTPKDLFNAQIAAKLHYNLVSDHDTRINNIPMKTFSDQIGRPYISNMEVSPGWGHWGVLNVDFSEKETGNIVNASTATPPEIIKAGHAANALVIVHHPYSDYGFLHNQDSVAGGHADGWKDFDLLELQSTISSDGKTLEALEDLTAENYKNINLDKLSSTIASAGVSQMDAKALVSAFAFWNAGEKKYLSAGSDQHQATNTALYPGIIRQYAKVGKDSKGATKADSKAYLAALKDGRSYVTMGPLFFTYDGESFGDTISTGKKALRIDAQAVNGLEKVVLYRNGVKVETKDLKGSTDKQTLEFMIDSTNDTKWYSYVAIDSTGNYAVSNPIWVNAEGGTPEPGGDSTKPGGQGSMDNGSADKAKSKGSNTGDNTHLLLLILLMTAAATGATIMVIHKKRHNG